MTTEQWQPFKITRSIRQSDANEYDFNLLKQDLKTSVLGDICCSIEGVNYTLDRSMLASKSPYFERLISEAKDEKETTDKIKNLQCRKSFHFIIGIIYGKNVRNAIMNEDDFVSILYDTKLLELETDLEIFKRIIEEMICPKAQLNDHMFALYQFVWRFPPQFDYLLSTLSDYFSNRLMDIYKKNEFLNLSEDEFVCILLHKSDNILERNTIGRICAEWICHDYHNRIQSANNLVDATKYRYEILQYCEWDPNLKIELLQLSESPDVQRVEIYFHKLLFSYSGDASFELPAKLNEKLTTIKSGDRVLFPNDQTCKWMSYLKKGIFCDVAITVQETTFKLHRIKLASVSGYFYDLFINSNESLEFEIVDSEGEPKMSKHELNQIDEVTFKSIVGYIYTQEIEVTSLTHLISLLKGSKFLKINDLFEKCFSKLLEIARNPSADILKMFQYVCKNEYVEVYNVMIKKMIALWPKLDENPEFVNISFDVLKEIVALPDLKIDNTDEITDLCSKWIFHDIRNRYNYTVEVAKAINRNVLMNIEQIKLEIPLNSTDFSQLYVKEQLISILTSSALVPSNYYKILKELQKPAFLILNKDNDLCVVDRNFNEIFQLAKITEESCRFSATSNEDVLFILFCNGTKFYFQMYAMSKKRVILLATDTRMDPEREFVILTCRDEVYFCNDLILLKYSVELNRWVTFAVTKDEEGESMEKRYTSDGERLYKFNFYRNYIDREAITLVRYYDFENDNWTLLPFVCNQNSPLKACIIQGELSVLFGSETYSFSRITQNWSKIFNGGFTFIEFKDRGQNIMYISKNNEVHLYSPFTKTWTKERNLDKVQRVVSIHTIFTGF